MCTDIIYSSTVAQKSRLSRYLRSINVMFLMCSYCSQSEPKFYFVASYADYMWPTVNSSQGKLVTCTIIMVTKMSSTR